VQVRVDDIKDGGLSLRFTEAADRLGTLAEALEGDDVRIDHPVTVAAYARWAGDMVEVEGEILTLANLACGRCLARYDLPLAIPFTLTYARDLPPVAAEEDGAEIELSAEEMGLIPFSGEEFDLSETIQEQVILALPLQPLCRETCRGLCPQCGADLNEEPCLCQPRPLNDRFAALRDFKITKD
jgi:uncharacterized protein